MKGKKLAPEVEALSDVLTALKNLKTDNEKRWVLETAASRLGVSVAGRQDTDAQGRAASRSTTAMLRADGSPKEFLRAKDPRSDVQRAACLAFYLTHMRDASHFNATSLTELNTEAAGSRINMTRALNNATNQNHYLAAAGGGWKQITTLGEEVVDALPDQEAAKTAEQRGRKTKRHRGKRTGRTAKK